MYHLFRELGGHCQPNEGSSKEESKESNRQTDFMLEDKHNLNGARNITILDNKTQPKKEVKKDWHGTIKR